MRSPQPLLVVDLFPEILDELLKLLGSLAADEWDKSTACPGWCVKDVALHLLGVEVGNLSRRRDGHAVAASITSWEALVTWLNAFNGSSPQKSSRISSIIQYFSQLHGSSIVSMWPLKIPQPVLT